MYTRVIVLIMLTLSIILQPLPSTSVVADLAPVTSSVDDLMYVVNWSRVYSEYFSYIAIDDFNNDGVNDVVKISYREGWLSDIEAIDVIHNSTLIEYKNKDNAYLYSAIVLNDVDGNGYKEVIGVYVNNTFMKIVLLEPGTKRIIYEKTYEVNLPESIYPLNLNHVVSDGTLQFMVSSVEPGYPPKLKTYLYTVDTKTGDVLSTSVINDKYYVIWCNMLAVDSNGDGLLDNRSRDPVIEAYITITGSGSIVGTVKVHDLEGTWSWSISRQNYIPMTVLLPYSGKGSVVTVIYGRIGTGGAFDALVLESYGMLNGTELYTITYDPNIHSVYSIMYIGGYLGLTILDKSSYVVRVDVYDSYTGEKEESIVVEETGTEVFASGASIGDLDSDGTYDLLVGVKNRLYLVSLDGEKDYLGLFRGDVVAYDGNTIIYDDRRLYVIETIVSDNEYGLYAVSLVENTTKPIGITIVRPENNTLTETPFTVEVSVKEEPVTPPILEVYRGEKLVLSKEMKQKDSYTYTVTIDYLDDGVYSLVARVDVYASKPVIVTVDNNPPKISVLKPLNHSFVQNTIDLEVVVHDQSLYGIKIVIDGEHYLSVKDKELEKYMKNGVVRYSTSIDITGLSEGSHEVEISAFDKLGHESTVVLTVYKDVTPPKITIKTPSILYDNTFVEGLRYYNRKYPVTIVAKDPNGVNKVVAYINNKPVEVYLNETGIGLVEVYLKPGYNNITVVVYDKAGNTGAETILVYLNTINPSIEVLSIEQRDHGIYFKVQSSTGSFIPLSKITVTIYKKIDNELKKITSKTYRTNNVEAIIEDTINVPDDGVYVVEVYVEDITGNNNTIKKEIIVDTQPPEITITRIDVKRTRVTIEWNITDKYSKITQVLLIIDNGKPIDVTNKNTYTVDLSPGKHVITLRAIDEKGNTGDKEAEVSIEHPLISFLKENLWLTIAVTALIIMAIVTLAKLRT